MSYIIWAFMFLIAEALLFAVQVPLRLRDSHALGVVALVVKALLVIFLAYGLVATTSAFWWNHSLFFGALYCALIGDFVASVAWSFVRLAKSRQPEGQTARPRPDKPLRRQRPVAIMSLVSGAGKDVTAEVTHILYHIQESRPYLSGLLKSNSGELFMAELRRRVADELASELSAGIEGVPADYLSNHVACDFAETVRWWMANPSYTPEEVCRFFLATTHL